MAIVNQTFVKAFLEGRNPIGLQYRRQDDRLRHRDRRRGEGQPLCRGEAGGPPKLYYMPWRQDKRINGLSFYVRRRFPRTRWSSRSGG